jgi:hypothetical protein
MEIRAKTDGGEPFSRSRFEQSRVSLRLTAIAVTLNQSCQLQVRVLPRHAPKEGTHWRGKMYFFYVTRKDFERLSSSVRASGIRMAMQRNSKGLVIDR